MYPVLYPVLVLHIHHLGLLYTYVCMPYVAGVHAHSSGSWCPCLRRQWLQAPPPEHAWAGQGQHLLQPDELVPLPHLYPRGGHLQVHGDHDGSKAGGRGLWAWHIGVFCTSGGVARHLQVGMWYLGSAWWDGGNVYCLCLCLMLVSLSNVGVSDGRSMGAGVWNIHVFGWGHSPCV